jgi:hypothetical protein
MSAILQVVFLSAILHHRCPLRCSGSHVAAIALLYTHAALQWCPLHSIYATYSSKAAAVTPGLFVRMHKEHISG